MQLRTRNDVEMKMFYPVRLHLRGLANGPHRPPPADSAEVSEVRRVRVPPSRVRCARRWALICESAGESSRSPRHPLSVPTADVHPEKKNVEAVENMVAQIKSRRAVTAADVRSLSGFSRPHGWPSATVGLYCARPYFMGWLEPSGQHQEGP